MCKPNKNPVAKITKYYMFCKVSDTVKNIPFILDWLLVWTAELGNQPGKVG